MEKTSISLKEIIYLSYVKINLYLCSSNEFKSHCGCYYYSYIFLFAMFQSILMIMVIMIEISLNFMYVTLIHQWYVSISNQSIACDIIRIMVHKLVLHRQYTAFRRLSVTHTAGLVKNKNVDGNKMKVIKTKKKLTPHIPHTPTVYYIACYGLLLTLIFFF